MSKLSTHVLDTALGRPADNLTVRIAVLDEGDARVLFERTTGPDGRIPDLLPEGALEARRYRLSFDTGAYFARRGRETLYPQVDIVVQVSAPNEHHHIPLLLSPFGYSTYRGT